MRVLKRFGITFAIALSVGAVGTVTIEKITNIRVPGLALVAFVLGATGAVEGHYYYLQWLKRPTENVKKAVEEALDEKFGEQLVARIDESQFEELYNSLALKSAAPEPFEMPVTAANPGEVQQLVEDIEDAWETPQPPPGKPKAIDWGKIA